MEVYIGDDILVASGIPDMGDYRHWMLILVVKFQFGAGRSEWTWN